MRIGSLLRLIAALLAFSLSSAAPAASQLVNGSGQLVGALNVLVDGTFYNVTFQEGSCDSLFNGCTTSAFTFHNVTDAADAAQALLDQVFLDTGAGQFDSDYTLTFGCSTNNIDGGFCGAIIPYDVVLINGNQPDPQGTIAENANFEAGDIVAYGGISGHSVNSDTVPFYVFAVFGPSRLPPLPEPSTWAMMILGFGAMGVALRGRRVAAAA